MAIIKKYELKTMSKDGMNNKLTELRKELMKLNAQVAIGTVPENAGKLKVIKKTIAKLNTKLTEVNKKI